MNSSFIALKSALKLGITEELTHPTKSGVFAPSVPVGQVGSPITRSMTFISISKINMELAETWTQIQTNTSKLGTICLKSHT